MSESTGHDFERSWWRERVKKRIVSHFAAGLVGGAPHRAYLRELGISKDSIFTGYDAVDNEHFASGAEAVRNSSQNSRDQHSPPDQYFLASGRFVPKKNFPRLIKAFAQYRRHVSSEKGWDLVLLGEGAERDAIEETIDTEDIRERVHLPGFKQYGELPTYYGLAGAFVHPSTREQWGLVVNEAMAAGLPVLVSDRCGCAPDLVDEGRSGFTFDPYDPSVLAELMTRVAHGDVDRKQMGAASRTIIADWGPERFAMGLRKAAEAAVDAGPPSTSLPERLLMKGLMYR
nr:glycosyltransferase [Salinibacter ruber]